MAQFNSIAMACQQCGTIRYIKPSHVAKGSGKFCSRPCMSAFKFAKHARACVHCGTSFKFVPSRAADAPGAGQFCSRVCADLARTRPDAQQTCEHCGTDFTVRPFRVEQGSGRYCSVACRGAARRKPRPAPVPEPEVPAECEWPAPDTRSYLLGVFDGEGCVVTGQNTNGSWFVAASVTMASPEICELFRQTWGGTLVNRSKPTTGGLIMNTWRIGATEGVPFLEYLSQHSLVKRRQAEIALGMARNMAQYSWAGYRRGVLLSGGQRILTDEDIKERTRLVAEIRSLNGARSRFGSLVP